MENLGCFCVVYNVDPVGIAYQSKESKAHIYVDVYNGACVVGKETRSGARVIGLSVLWYDDGLSRPTSWV